MCIRDRLEISKMTDLPIISFLLLSQSSPTLWLTYPPVSLHLFNVSRWYLNFYRLSIAYALWPGPVSYTHLDVYKRQILYILITEQREGRKIRDFGPLLLGK